MFSEIKDCYIGTRSREGCMVFINGRPLNPRLDLANHSPTGFEWGYQGSGPHQLALAILADALRDDESALSLYHHFTAEVISRFPCDKVFYLSKNYVKYWSANHANL